MNVSKLTAAVLAVLVVTTGLGAAAAMPGNGNAPDDTGSNAANAPTDDADAPERNVTDEGMSPEEVADRAENDSVAEADGESARSAAERRGPPADLPEQVPDHVGEIHQRIASFLDGSLDDVGTAVSDVTPDDEGSDDEETATATPTATTEA
jgi:hypothetical protein